MYLIKMNKCETDESKVVHVKSVTSLVMRMLLAHVIHVPLLPLDGRGQIAAVRIAQGLIHQHDEDLEKLPKL